MIVIYQVMGGGTSLMLFLALKLYHMINNLNIEFCSYTYVFS